jgi:hypothetical protein
VTSWLPVLTYRSVAVAAKLWTPPAGVTTVDVGLPGSVVDGPRTDDGVVVVHTGLISEAVGAAGLPGIWGAGAVAWAVVDTDNPTVADVTRATIPSTPTRTMPLRLGMTPARFITSDRPLAGLLEINLTNSNRVTT